MFAAAPALSRPSLLTGRRPAKQSAATRAPRRSVAPRAALPVQEIAQLAADAAPGEACRRRRRRSPFAACSPARSCSRHLAMCKNTWAHLSAPRLPYKALTNHSLAAHPLPAGTVDAPVWAIAIGAWARGYRRRWQVKACTPLHARLAPAVRSTRPSRCTTPHCLLPSPPAIQPQAPSS